MQGIVIGQTNNQELVSKLGTPSAVSSFGEQVYYYIHTKHDVSAFHAPTLIEQNVVAFTFDKGGKLLSINQYDKDSFNDLQISSRTVEIKGNELNPYKQIMSNVGKYKKTK